MLSNWFEKEFPDVLASCLQTPIDEAGLNDYDPDDCWCAAIVICLECGFVNPTIWPDEPGNEFLLECQECGSHHSAPLINE